MKALLDFLRGDFAFHTGEIISLGQDKWWQGVTGWGASGATATQVNEQTAMASSTAYACTRALSETLSTLPAVVMESQDLETRTKARENPMWALLHDQPNPRMDSISWYGLNATRVINRGSSLNVIEYNGAGLPIALWPVHNSRYEVFCEPARPAPGGRYYPGEVYYRVWVDDYCGGSGGSRSYMVGSDEVLNIVGWDTENGLTACGVIKRMAREIGLDIDQTDYAASMFANGAIPLGFIKHPYLDDEDQRKGLRSDINKMHQGRENWNKVGILWDKDADWVKLNFTPSDVQALESRIFSAKAICRGYNVPPAIVQIFEDYKFQTVEAMLKHFIMLGIRPLASRFEKAIKLQVLDNVPTTGSLFLEFLLEALLRGDPKTQAELSNIYRQTGILSGDEIRQRDLNMNPMEDGLGTARLAPLNYATLKDIVSGAGIKSKQSSSGGSSGGGENVQQPRFDKAAVAAMVKEVLAGNGHA